jgi:hypothetical protein
MAPDGVVEFYSFQIGREKGPLVEISVIAHMTDLKAHVADVGGGGGKNPIEPPRCPDYFWNEPAAQSLGSDQPPCPHTQQGGRALSLGGRSPREAREVPAKQEMISSTLKHWR